MNAETTMLFATFGIGVVLTLVAGFYCVLTTRSLIRALIGLEILTKAVTLLIILAGCVTGRMALAQALAVTALVAVGAGIVFGAAPAFTAARVDVQTSLKEGARGDVGGARSGRLWKSRFLT